MILGLGIDVAELDRIQETLARFGERFLQKILTADEQARVPAGNTAAAFVAARFAAKEAAVKALGTGFRDGISPRDVEVRSLASGQPVLHLGGAAATRAQALGVRRCHLSLTHGRQTAAAVVILED